MKLPSTALAVPKSVGLALRRNWMIALVALVFVSYTLFTFAIYWARALDGKLQNFLLIGQMFGIPANLAAHGVRPTFYGPKQTGWDGQFYYYLSNDIFDKRHASSVFDVTAYRWQRVGFALFVGIIASVLGLGWVSPQTYLLTYFLLVLTAVVAGSLLFKQFKASPWLVLLWALCCGTQITLFNGLPDASADAFLIIGLFALFKRRFVVSAIAMSFAVLSREAYVVFPAFILAALVVDQLWQALRPGKHAVAANVVLAALRDLFRPRWHYLYLMPIAAFVVWQTWVTHHFGVRPSSQAGGVVGTPFAAWWHYLTFGLQGKHPYLGNTRTAHLETGTLVCFTIVMILIFTVGVMTLFRRKVSVAPEVRGFAAAVVVMAATYTAFGGTVIMHYSGYMKAAALFFFAVPFLLAAGKFEIKWKLPVNLLVLCCLLYSSYYHLSERIFTYPMPTFQYTQLSAIKQTNDLACLGDYHAQIDVQSVKLREAPGLEKLFGGTDEAVVRVKLTNTSAQTMVSTTGNHPVFMSYEWVDRDNKVTFSGWRSAIVDPIAPGQSAPIDVVVDIPHLQRTSTLKLSPVQEGCAWYYQLYPDAAPVLPLLTTEELDR